MKSLLHPALVPKGPLRIAQRFNACHYPHCSWKCLNDIHSGSWTRVGPNPVRGGLFIEVWPPPQLVAFCFSAARNSLAHLPDDQGPRRRKTKSNKRREVAGTINRPPLTGFFGGDGQSTLYRHPKDVGNDKPFGERVGVNVGD